MTVSLLIRELPFKARDITAYLRKKKLNFVIIGDPSDNSGDRYVDNNIIPINRLLLKQTVGNLNFCKELFNLANKILEKVAYFFYYFCANGCAKCKKLVYYL